MLGYKPSNPYLSKGPKRQEKSTGAQEAAKAGARLGRFGDAVRSGKPRDIVGRIQDFSKAEAERQRKKKEEEAKPKSTAPQKGFIGRMIDKYYYGKKE